VILTSLNRQKEGNMDIEKMNVIEFKVYCDLLPLVYEVYKVQNNGLVCGTGAEEIRDKMYQAIKEANILQ
jgi:hypothetical protein